MEIEKTLAASRLDARRIVEISIPRMNDIAFAIPCGGFTLPSCVPVSSPPKGFPMKRRYVLIAMAFLGLFAAVRPAMA